MARKKSNRYRSDTVKPRRLVRRGLKAVLYLALGLSGIVLVSAALAYSYHAMLESSWLRLEEIRILGLKHLEPKTVLNALKVPRDTNILTLKTAQLARRAERLEWVKSAIVRLEPPTRLVVEITEHEPIAMIEAEDWLFIDRAGKLFTRATPQPSSGFLRISGFKGVNLRVGDTLPSESWEVLEALVRTLDHNQGWLPLTHIVRCHWNAGTGMVLYTTLGDFPIQLGQENFDQKMDRLQRILSMLTDRQWLNSVTRIDLDYPNRAYVAGQFSVPRES